MHESRATENGREQPTLRHSPFAFIYVQGKFGGDLAGSAALLRLVWGNASLTEKPGGVNGDRRCVAFGQRDDSSAQCSYRLELCFVECAIA